MCKSVIHFKLVVMYGMCGKVGGVPPRWISSCVSVIGKPLLSPWDYLVPLSNIYFSFFKTFLLLNIIKVNTKIYSSADHFNLIRGISTIQIKK